MLPLRTFYSFLISHTFVGFILDLLSSQDGMEFSCVVSLLDGVWNSPQMRESGGRPTSHPSEFFYAFKIVHSFESIFITE